MRSIEGHGGAIHIIIDGYNLIGIHHGNLRSERENLIQLLLRFHRIRGHEITLVFDGWYGGGRETRSGTGGITIIYSGIGEKADNVIKKIISNPARKWVVVSSDREVCSFAWTTPSIPIPSGLFLKQVESITQGKAEGPESGAPFGKDFEEEPDYSRKGNPHRLSKRQKEIERVLNKL